jgi:hypothetical protein
MAHRHFSKELSATERQSYGKSAAIAGAVFAGYKVLTFELVSDPGYVSAGNHQPPGKLVHAQPAGTAVKLGHQIKPRQSHAELTPQAETDQVFDFRRAREQAQPQTQGLMVAFLGPGLQIKNFLIAPARTIVVFTYV